MYFVASRLTAPIRILTGVVTLGIAIIGCSPTASSNATPTVTEIVDGDTVVINFAGQHETVRLLGIDTPETVDPNRPIQCFGAEASQYISALVPPGTEVFVERDIEARDRFGRLLVYLYRKSDGLFINAAMLEQGFADLAIHQPNNAYGTELENALTSARTQARGLWSVCGGPDVALDPPPASEESQ